MEKRHRIVLKCSDPGNHIDEAVLIQQDGQHVFFSEDLIEEAKAKICELEAPDKNTVISIINGIMRKIDD